MAIAGLGVLVIPPLVVGLSGTASVDALWTALRLVALEAGTLVAAGIALGAFRPDLIRVIKGKTLHRLHVTVGVTGFSLAIVHGIMVAIYGVSGYGSRTLVIMPLAVLAVALLLIGSALARRRLRRAWRWIHRLSYLLLATILVHAFTLGYDLGTGVTMKICFSIYAAIAAAGLAYRLSGSLRALKRPQ